MSVEFFVGNTYSFESRSPVKLGLTWSNKTLLGILNYDVAISYRDVVSIHRDIFPTLPNGTPSDPRTLTYLLFKDNASNNDRKLIAKEWINLSTVELIDNVTISITVNGAKSQDVDRINNSLSLLGFNNFTTQIISG